MTQSTCRACCGLRNGLIGPSSRLGGRPRPTPVDRVFPLRWSPALGQVGGDALAGPGHGRGRPRRPRRCPGSRVDLVALRHQARVRVAEERERGEAGAGRRHTARGARDVDGGTAVSAFSYTFLSRWVCMRADLDGKLWPRHGESNPDSQRACSLGEPSWRATPAKVGRDFSLVQS